MFDADRPILSSEQDRLGRTTFAKYLARCILDHSNKESLVIGLYGGWGVGKTSVVNLTLEELRLAANNMFDEERPVILNFSGWSYSGQHQLIHNFFRRLSSELRQASYLENSEKIISLLELYTSYFTHKPVPKKLRFRFLTWLPFFRKKQAVAWDSGRDLTQVKAELNDLLSKQKHKIIIVMDNISRLDDVEIKQVFQIVKSMGDYVNTVYLLTMDKKMVIQAMDKLHHGGGAEFLEKIVQLPFEIPPISKQDLENILIEKLKTIIEQLPEDSWDKEYWGDIYYSTIKHFFENCREITRYVNTVSFGFSRIKDIVNPVDFFAISAIYTFSPQVYYGVRDNKDLFTDLMTNVYSFDAVKLTEDKGRCDEILQRPGKIPYELLLQLLIRLFPRLRSMYQSNIPFYHSESIARKNKRICCADIFDIYFRLSMPTGQISESEMQAILRILHDEEGFALALLRLNQDNKISKFLDALDSSIISQLPHEDISKMVDALFDSGDLFPEGENTILNFNTPMRIHRILHQLIQTISSKEDRFIIFRDAITKAVNSVYIIVHELIMQGKEHNESEDTVVPLEERSFSPSQLDQLQKLAVAKIAYWAELGRLGEHPKLLPILFAWRAWGTENEVRQFVTKLIEDDKGLLAFLCAALKDPIDQTISKLEKNAGWEKYLENIDAFIPLSLVEPRVKFLFEDPLFEKLREREQLAILIFLDLIKSDTVKIIPNTVG